MSLFNKKNKEWRTTEIKTTYLIDNNLNNFTLKFYPPLKPFKNHLTDKQAMEEIHKIIEEWIKENPSHYFLQHNRFS